MTRYLLVVAKTADEASRMVDHAAATTKHRQELEDCTIIRVDADAWTGRWIAAVLLALKDGSLSDNGKVSGGDGFYVDLDILQKNINDGRTHVTKEMLFRLACQNLMGPEPDAETYIYGVLVGSEIYSNNQRLSHKQHQEIHIMQSRKFGGKVDPAFRVRCFVVSKQDVEVIDAVESVM